MVLFIFSGEAGGGEERDKSAGETSVRPVANHMLQKRFEIVK